MPKRVDHEERRRDIAHAVWRIASREGLEAVSVRQVAREAGISSPLVQRHFPEKEAMLRYALDELTRVANARAQERIAAAAPDEGAPDYPFRLFRALLAEFLPLDEERRTTLLVSLAFFNRALADPGLASVYRDGNPVLIDAIAGLLRREQDAGRAAAGFDPDREANTLLTLTVGLGTDLLLGITTTGSALALVDYHLDRLLLPVAAGAREGGSDPR